MGGLFSSPKPPPPVTDPIVASTAGQVANIGTAQAQQIGSNADQFTPYGSRKFAPVGTQQIPGPDGKPIDVTRWGVTDTESDSQRRIRELNEQASIGTLGVANNQIAQLGSVLNTPFNYRGIQAGGTLPTSGPSLRGLSAAPKLERMTAGGPIQSSVSLGNTAGRIGDAGVIDRSFDPRDAATTFAATPGARTSFGPDDFSKDRDRVVAALAQRAAPEEEARRRALAGRLAGEGAMRGTAAFSQAEREFNRSLSDAALGRQIAGGQEQSRLFADAARKFSEENAGRGLAYNMALGRGTFGNQAIGQNNAAWLANTQLGNQAQAQLFGQLSARQQAEAQAQAQNNAALMAAAQYGLGAQAQAFGQQGQRISANNAVAQQQAQNQWNRIMYGNQNAQQGFTNATTLAQMQDVQRQQDITERERLRANIFNEAASLRTGNQVTPQSFAQFQGAQVAPTNVAGNMFAANALQTQQWDAQEKARAQAQAAALGGLSGVLGSAVTGGMQFGMPGSGTNMFGLSRFGA